MTRRRVVLVGGGQAHLSTIARLESIASTGCEVIVISKGSYHYYSRMGPTLLGGGCTPGEARFHVRRMCERHGGQFVESEVASIRPRQRNLILTDNTSIKYDIASFDVGSVVEPGTVAIESDENLVPVKPIERLFEVGCRIRELADLSPVSVCVVGGGQTGVEAAANCAALGRKTTHPVEVSVVMRRTLLARHPDLVRRKVLRKLSRIGVSVREHSEVSLCLRDSLVTTSGEKIHFDICLLATGTSPPDLFRKSGLETGTTGGLLVEDTLNTHEHPELFGAGECADFRPRPLPGVTDHAILQGRVLLQNLRATASGDHLTAFEPPRRGTLHMSYGAGTGLYRRGPFTFGGRPALFIKARVDRTFMRRFQECDESSVRVDCPGIASVPPDQ